MGNYLTIQKGSLSVGETCLFKYPTLFINKGEIVGIIGNNGVGKSLFLKDIQTSLKVAYTYIPQLKENHNQKSGGENTRQYLNALVKSKSELFLIDEPTNDLDSHQKKWFMDTIKRLQTTTLLISHDREVLQLCSQIWLIKDGMLQAYTGNFSDYQMQREIEEKTQQLKHEKYVAEKKHLEQVLLDKQKRMQRLRKEPNVVSSEIRFMKSSRVYFGVKEKSMARVANAIKTRIDKLEKVEAVKKAVPIRMTATQDESKLGKYVIKMEQSSYGNLWRDSTCFIERGKVIGIIGENGCGKSTLISKIVKREGIFVSPSAKIGYFKQDLSLLDPTLSVMENLEQGTTQSKVVIYAVLDKLAIPKSCWDNPVALLSGGELVKVSLAKLFLQDTNLLILDEPTNHLDIFAIKGLEELIKSYTGTVLLVSHDKTLLEEVCDDYLLFHQQRIYLGRTPSKKSHNDALLEDFRKAKVLSQLSCCPNDEELKIIYENLLKK